MKKVVIIQEVLPQYRVPLFEAMRDSLADRDIQLTLVYGQGTAAYQARRDGADAAWAKPIRNILIPVPRGANATWQPAIRIASGADLVVVEHANRHLANYALLAIQHAGGPRLAFWGHGANLQSRRPDGYREKLKSLTARLPHWWFAYTDGSAARVAACGFPKDRITVLQNAVDTKAYETALPARDPHACVYVGSLYDDKRLDFLFAAGEHIAEQIPTFKLTIAGDGPERDIVQQAAIRHRWLSYVGPAFGADKATLVSSASLMLIPGLVGLPVLDAFAGRTPVVTLAASFHSPEFEYLSHDRNGIVLAGDPSPLDYASAVATLLTAPDRLERLRNGCADAARQINLPEMARRYCNGIIQALGS